MQTGREKIVEKACLIALARKSYQRQEAEASLDELAELTISAGGEIADRIIQIRPPDSKYYIGKGMVSKIKEDTFEISLPDSTEIISLP